MWHEARKQERLIRGMIVDYRRRAERRKDFYEKIKAEPTQFLQLHGRPCKIHLDPAIAAAGEGPAIMMPWQGDTNNVIDRFDARAHLDYIPEVKIPDIPPEDLHQEERQCNYERYRILAQNAFLGISEDKFLQQLALEEQFGVTIDEKELQKEKLSEKKGMGAAIAYNYNDPGAQPSCSNGPEIKKVEMKDSDDDSDLEIIDVDLSIDVNKMEASQAHELNAVGPLFGMPGCDLFSFLTGDADDAEHQKQLLREEKEKAMFSGRKSRRERRAHRDKKLATRIVSPPSYAAPSCRQRSLSRSLSRSASRSPSPENENIQFITSFGGEDNEAKSSQFQKILYADKLKCNLKKTELYAEVARKPPKAGSSTEDRRLQGSSGFRARSETRSYSHSRSRSKSRSRSRRKSRTKSSSPLDSPSISSRSRSNSPYRRSRSRSRSNSLKKRSRSPSNIDKSSQSKPTVPRYYGRRKEDKSSSELSVDSDSSDVDNEKNKSTVGIKSNTNQNQIRLSGSSTKGPSRETLTLKEKLKRKMQAQLSKQLRADKRAEAERQERENRRQARRDEEMRELVIKLRRKQREMRHLQNRRSSDDNSDRSRSGSSSRLSPSGEKRREHRSRSKSTSPKPKRVPVWETSIEPPSYKSKIQEPENSHTSSSKKRHQDSTEGYYNRNERRYEEEKPQSYSSRYERSARDHLGRGFEYNRYEQPYENRWEQEKTYASGRKRPFASSRGGFRTQGYRSLQQSHGDGSSHLRSQDQDGGDSARNDSKHKVKLVDY
ncbi:CLK4-associating serine/arginine rich protein isoform X2 [Battus philenor]|uniref:CLK4-associating serine/arginine rich protein isoform X2 n=1 Tax=Battus philenor TaxID=42288 RepID=UPI0035CFCEC3